MVKTLILICFLFAVIGITKSQHVGSCGNETSNAYGTLTARPLGIVNHKVDFPHDTQSSTEYCEESRAAVVFTKNFSRNCLTDLPKQANSLLAYGINKAIKKSCKTQADRDELGRNLGCFNQFERLITNEYKGLAERYQRSIFLEDRKQKIPSACCNFFRMKKNMLAIGKNKCSKEQVAYLKFFIESFSGDLLDLLCAGITLEGEKCKSIVLPPKNVTEGMPVHDSFIPALLTLINGL